MKKVLITGGAGFIGFHLGKKLAQSGYQVDLLDNFSRGVRDPEIEDAINSRNLQLLNGDILDSQFLNTLDKDYTYIYHLAAIVGVEHVLKRPFDVLTLNLRLLDNMIHLAEKQSQLEKFVFASTSEVYAGTLKYFEMAIPTPEQTPLATLDLQSPRTSYMLSKIYGEAMLNQSDLPIMIIRPHNIYGPRMGMAHVIPQQLNKINSAKEFSDVTVYTPEHQRTFCYISDAVNLIQLLTENSKSTGEVFNIGNESPEVKIKKVVEIVAETIGKKVHFVYKDMNSGSPARRCPSMHKAFSLVGYPDALVSLEQGIAQTYSWYKDKIFSGFQKSAS
ncbi:NAD-dependent epimerase/dehydratase family protein [Desulfobaculum bizertense]|uniref:dTDP-glucose 4,6-dehydratase n=1 Tax=Desulfobaculum bizertense DSM 18034 TaxID=1121442 RepID=A0A1T4WYE1_9BACT|nr:NAD(P)-dependent oxidoreductase [Desulfobaculum bizertense]SKA82372.1 dTDP-glucose 4,6-dehydratase [Desulfobaculum bizertense DSM 18034]